MTLPKEAELREEDLDPHAVVIDDPNLPRVFLIGDSISLGYTPGVRRLLTGEANVHRPPCNCQHTAFGLENIHDWLRGETWDLIHFNWGIWDTHYMHDGPNDFHGNMVPNDQEDIDGAYIRDAPDVYADHLRQIIAVMQPVASRLVFAETTPIMRRHGERFKDISRFNEAAAGVMAEHGIPINSLYGYVLPKAADWQTEDKVHFNDLGNEKLSKQVAVIIREHLG